MYESSFAKITEKYFKASPWPTVEAIAPYVDYDHVFCMLYKELYYRHLFARLTPSLEQRAGAWANYCELFGVVLQGNVNMQLPNLWLWDMVDEFLYQFQSFCQFRGKLAQKSAEEVEALRSQPALWSVLGVANYLQALVDASGVTALLAAERAGEVGFSANEGYEYHSSNVLRVLGYFAVTGLSRLHVLLGDYGGALRALDPIALERPGLFTKVAGAHVTTLYHAGFAYLMARRYTDAIRAFNAALVYVARHKAAAARSAGYEQLVKKAEQMYALLAVAVALCPAHKLLEDGVKSALAEKYAEKMVRMAGGEEGIYDELFSYACPKFVTASPPDFADPGAAHSTEAYRLQLRLFLGEVRAAALLPHVRSFLKLYTTIPLAKLAVLMEYDPAALRQALLALKRKATVKEWRGGASPLDGVWTATGDVDFYIDGDMVHVVDSQPQRQFAYELTTAIDRQRALQGALRRGEAFEITA